MNRRRYRATTPRTIRRPSEPSARYSFVYVVRITPSRLVFSWISRDSRFSIVWKIGTPDRRAQNVASGGDHFFEITESRYYATYWATRFCVSIGPPNSVVDRRDRVFFSLVFIRRFFFFWGLILLAGSNDIRFLDTAVPLHTVLPVKVDFDSHVINVNKYGVSTFPGKLL